MIGLVTNGTYIDNFNTIVSRFVYKYWRCGQMDGIRWTANFLLGVVLVMCTLAPFLAAMFGGRFIRAIRWLETIPGQPGRPGRTPQELDKLAVESASFIPEDTVPEDTVAEWIRVSGSCAD
jgi:hypothetical protein